MNTQGLPRRSGFSDIDQTGDPMKYVRRLDDRSASEFWQAIKSQILTLLDVREGDHVLDIGCGTGDDTRALAHAVGPRGRVVGVDISATMIKEARRRSESLGVPVEYHLGDAQHLGLPDSSFDCCRAERVLQHLDDPQRALAEMFRVARPGARIVAAEPDYGTTTIKGGDPTVTRKLVDCRCAHFRSGRVGMLLPLFYKRLGLVDVAAKLEQVVSTHIGDEEERLLLHKYVEPAITAGVVSEPEGTRWIEDLKEAEAVGRYRHAICLFLASGRKPS